MSMVSILNSDLRKKFSSGYKANHGLEHILERLMPSEIKYKGRKILDIQPAPKILAIYFPQYHKSEINDRLWGDNFTEWTLLKKYKGEDIWKPLVDEGGGVHMHTLTHKHTS